MVSVHSGIFFFSPPIIYYAHSSPSPDPRCWDKRSIRGEIARHWNRVEWRKNVRRMPTRMLRFVGHSAVIQFWQRRTDLSVNEFLPFRPRSAIHPRFLVEGRPLVSRLTSLVVHRNRPRPGNRRIDRPPTNDDDDDDDDDSIPPGLGERERGREFLTIEISTIFFPLLF